MPRASLLACLSRFARDAGADLRYGVAVEDASRDGASVHVASSAGTLAAPLIVGADGARSRVRDFLASESSDPSLFEPRGRVPRTRIARCDQEEAVLAPKLVVRSRE